MRENHKKFLLKKVSYVDVKHIKNGYYRDIITENGHWLNALLNGKIDAITKEQSDFLETFKKCRYKNFKALPKNKYIQALFLWKGKKWITSIALTLVNKDNWQGTILLNKSSFESREAERERMKLLSKCNPPSVEKKKKKYGFPKPDPNQTYTWNDQGFQTREGHKIMSSKGYRNSRLK